MKLKNLIDSIGAEVIGHADMEIGGLAYDSRGVKREDKTLFAALPGERVDGRGFIKNAVDNGAVAVLAQRATKGVNAPQIIVRDARAALSRISDRFYGEPSKGLLMVGVTGTNGKTTTTYLLESIFSSAGFSPGVIGTVNYRYGGHVFPAPHTTPEAPKLHKILKEMCDSGVTHCVMEVSSHALHQKRAADVRFNAGIFT
ncbi:MAG: UDP-N-acetylmuramoyl-L-alanyl-D-glutamate--2,6-diaminopimelate ligase, partial [Deltaproteobacteria bacterium]|nr:UDP-N-acetylmuramoyl-L-alanyl-D-glutamate--2,6-diaminopimelate ligase [Deltaproteobacteria bacterium]